MNDEDQHGHKMKSALFPNFVRMFFLLLNILLFQ